MEKHIILRFFIKRGVKTLSLSTRCFNHEIHQTIFDHCVLSALEIMLQEYPIQVMLSELDKPSPNTSCITATNV